MLFKLINQNKLPLLIRSSRQLRTYSIGPRSTDNVSELINTPLSKPIRNLEQGTKEDYVRYSKSKAVEFKASENYRSDSGYPPSQYCFVTYSTVIFLIYFCLLREESDLDVKLYEPWSGNEKIYSEILKVQLKKNTSSSSVDEIKEKIKALEEKIAKNE